MAELFRALGALCESPAPEHAAVWQVLGVAGVPDVSEYTDLFVLNLYPYGSVYLGAEGMLGGEARDRIAGFWRALRLRPPAEPDHLAALLGLYAALIDRETHEPDAAHRLSCRQARAALFWEHLVPWLPPYLGRLGTVAPERYRRWGGLVREALTEEAASLGAAPGLSAHLRAAPALPDPRRDGSRPFIEGLLAPVRCGMILTRTDLARAARDLGLGLRMGERKFTLAALLSQAAEPVLGWLARETEACGAAHLRDTAWAGAAARFWAGRASAAASLLTELQGSTRDAAAMP